jgi:hypothetical protein
MYASFMAVSLFSREIEGHKEEHLPGSAIEHLWRVVSGASGEPVWWIPQYHHMETSTLHNFFVQPRERLAVPCPRRPHEDTLDMVLSQFGQWA